MEGKICTRISDSFPGECYNFGLVNIEFLIVRSSVSDCRRLQSGYLECLIESHKSFI
jgi:hypothetical protein